MFVIKLTSLHVTRLLCRVRTMWWLQLATLLFEQIARISQRRIRGCLSWRCPLAIRQEAANLWYLAVPRMRLRLIRATFLLRNGLNDSQDFAQTRHIYQQLQIRKSKRYRRFSHVEIIKTIQMKMGQPLYRFTEKILQALAKGLGDY